ncbi:hypothetical protein CBS101457_004422 [Exobasidium rhododendri]|nr:hypothetical protein CBS101457_004422 [Exobasidium rhododendri]
MDIARPRTSSSTGGQDATGPVAKLTPSCSRCRSKKLRCHFTDSNRSSACMNCLTKGLEDQCHRDVRIARGKKRARSDMNAVAQPSDQSGLKGKMKEIEMDPRVEISILRKRVAELEKLERDCRKPLSPPSTGDELMRDTLTPSGSNSPGETAPTAVPAAAATAEASSSPSSIGAMKRNDIEEAAILLEDFAANGATRNGSGTGKSSVNLPPDTPQRKWQNLTALPERLQLLQQAKECPYASDGLIVRELVSVYLYRVNHLAGHVIYSPGFQRAVEAFLSMSVEEVVTSKIFIDPCCLSTLMLVLCLGFEFHPWQLPPGQSPTPGFLAVHSIRKRSIDPTKQWYSIGRRALAIEDSYRLNSLPALQAACLFLVQGKESREWSRMLHQIAIASAQDFGLHRLGRAEAPTVEKSEFVRLECGIRIWNFLAMRDWSLAIDQGYTFVIQPEHSTTRLPLNLGDDDLEAGIRTAKPSSEWTMMSFVITQIELAKVVRDSSTLRNRQLLNEEQSQSSRLAHQSILKDKLIQFQTRMPQYFTLDSRVNTPGLIHVQRWLLNQQIFDFQLRLLRSGLTSSALERRNCLQLAENVIDQQANIRRICPVIDNLQINFFHLFGACLILLLDLIEQYQTSDGEEEVAWCRGDSRHKISTALQAFPTGNLKYSRGRHVLEVLMEYEEDCHQKAQEGKKGLSRLSQERDGSAKNFLSLARRLVTDAQMTTREGGQNEQSQEEHIWPALLSNCWTAPSIPIQTVLPTAGAWRTIPYFEDRSCLSSSGKAVHSTSTTKEAMLPSGDSDLSPFQEADSMRASINQAALFDWALGRGLDPFRNHEEAHTASSDLQHFPSDFSHTSPDYTLDRYLRELNNSDQFYVEKNRHQQPLFGRS